MTATTGTERRYDADYREEVTLRDGTRATLRLVTPADGDLLRRGFDHLSSESRAKRFLTSKPSLTDDELHYLTCVDQHDHFAMGAVATVDGCEEGLAIARFIRLADREAAEPAITVADGAQKKGLGTLLLARLGEAAWERGVRRFDCLVLVSNPEMRELLRRLDPHATMTLDAPGVLEMHLAVPDPATAPDHARNARVLSIAAREDVEVLPRER